MSTTVHDAWLKSTLGIDPAALTPAAALPPAGPGKQAQDFHAQFETALGALDQALDYVSENADAAKAEPIASKRGGLIAIYQTAAQQIDPADESKAKAAIVQAVAQVKAIAVMATTAKAAAEKALTVWKALEPKGEEAATQLSEMTDWGHPKAAALQPPLDAVLQAATAKRYADACRALAAFLPTLQPVRADYQKQTAAQAQYEPVRNELEPRLAKAAAAAFKKLEPMQQALPPAQALMDKDAVAKNFVDALSKTASLGTKLGEFEKVAGELEQQKQAYEAAMTALQPRLDVAAQCPFKRLDAMKNEATGLAAATVELAKTEDFVTALKHTADLGGRMDLLEHAVKDLEDAKKAFADARQALDPKLQAADQATAHPSLAADKKAIDDAIPIMEQAAGDEDYSSAQSSVQDVTSKVDQYVAATQAIDDKKKKYEDAWATIQPLLDQMNSSRNDDLAPMQQTILASVDAIKKQVEAEDYDGALTATETLKRMFDEYLNADAKKIVSITYNGKTYYGTDKECVALKLRLVKAGIAQVFPPIQHRAEGIEGQYNDLKALNDKQYIVAWFVTGLAGANLEAVAAGIAAHKAAIAGMSGVTEADAALQAYKNACASINTSGKALADYMSAIDLGGKIIIGVLEVVEVVCFSIAAACGAAILVPEGAGILASMAGNSISATTFGALQATAEQAAPMTQGETVDWSKAGQVIGKAALLNGVGGLLGGAMGGKLKQDVGLQVIERLGIESPEAKARVLGAIEGSMANLVQAAIASRPDLAAGKMTVAQFVAVLAENAIAGGLGGAITPGMKKV